MFGFGKKSKEEATPAAPIREISEESELEEALTSGTHESAFCGAFVSKRMSEVSQVIP